MRVVVAAVAVLACVLVASGCASSGKKRTTSVRNTALGPAGAGTLTRSDYVRIARASNRYFSIFPMEPGKTRCAIPERGPSQRSLHGMCETRFRPAMVHSPGVILVTFTERWRSACPPPDLDVACMPRWRRHSWQVTDGTRVATGRAGVRVVGTRSSGRTAPQDYK
jgi:hypothetical protein